MPVQWNQAQVEARVREGALRGVLIAAQLVHARGTELIQSPPKTGRIYRRRGIKHQASAPGEAPATDTGRLVGSGDVILDAPNLSARVNWSARHAKLLELGTERMAPRPFARRALMERRDEIREVVRAQIAAALAR